MRDLTVTEQSWNGDTTLDSHDAAADATYSFSYARI